MSTPSEGFEPPEDMIGVDPAKVEWPDAMYAVVKPGDHVLVAFTHSPPLDQLQGLADRLVERFPGVEFTWMADASIVVLREEDRDG